MQQIVEESSGSKKYNIGYFIISFLGVFILSFIVLFIIEKEVRSVQLAEVKTSEKRLVSLENDNIGEEFSMVLSDLHYLHHAYEGKLYDPDSYGEIAANWREFSTQRNIYDQIRYIDASGDEKIRININENGAYIVPEPELQNKKDRYYFNETTVLPEESVYISPVDLNIEQDKIEQPYKPMIRLSTPLYDHTGKLKGIIVLNYLAKNMIENFRSLAESSRGEMVLLNSDSYWLSSKKAEQEWNFMFPKREKDTFESIYPVEWKAIVSNDGQILTENGLFTYTSVSVRHKMMGNNNTSLPDQTVQLDDGRWYIVSTILRDGAHRSLFIDDTGALVLDVFKKNIFYFSMVSVISIIIAFLVYMNRRSYSRIKYYSEYDTLTKVYNRRAGITRLDQIFPLDERRNNVVSLCFIDVNGLKQVNDVLGHNHGDDLIVSVVEVIKTVIRENDFIIRLGGDEFLLVFAGISLETAEKVWGRILAGYEKINEEENRPYIISVSHGVVSRSNSEKSQVDELIKRADEKMYEEKRIIKETLNVIKS